MLLFLTAPIQYMPKAVLASVVFLIGIELVDLAGMRKVLALRSTSSSSPRSSPLPSSASASSRESSWPSSRRSSTTSVARTGPAPQCCSAGADTCWHGRAVDPDARTMPGLVVYRFAGSLYYANANLFFEQTSAFADRRDPPRWLCIDAGTHPRHRLQRRRDHPPTPRRARRARHQARHRRTDRRQFEELLDRYGLIDLLGQDHIFDTVEEAVAAFDQLTTV